MPGAPTFGLALYTGQRFGDPTSWYRDVVPIARAAEEAGFDAFWVSEHHGLDDGYVPAPLSVLAAVSSVTERISLGTGLLLAPLRHPLRLAEEVAVVDQLSGGRLILGLGLGYNDDELRALELGGADRGTRLEELVEMLRLAWRGQRFSYEGRSLRLDDVRVTPRPFEGREVPILIGAYAPRARARAARVADGHLVGRGTEEIVAAAVGDIERAGGPQRRPFTLAVNLALVLDEPDGSGDAALEAFAAQQAVYERIQRGKNVYSGQVPDVRDDGALTLGRIDAYLQGRGTAEQVAARIRRSIDAMPAWAEPHIGLRIIFPEDDVDRIVARIHAFGARVLPLVRG